MATQRSDTLLSHETASAKRRVVDSALEYIDYQEKLAGMRQATRFASLRSDLLQLRTKMPGPVAELLPAPEGRDPLRGHPGSWVMVGGGRRFGENIGLLNWQPVLHDLLADDEGYARGMQIQIMPMEFTWHPSAKKATLSRLDILNVISLNPMSRLLNPSSWSFRWSWERQTLCGSDGKICSTGSLQTGRGVAGELQLGPNTWLRTGILLKAEVGGHDFLSKQIYSQIGSEWLAVAAISGTIKFFLHSEAARRFYLDRVESRFSSGYSAALPISENFNIRAGLNWQQVGLADHKASTLAWSGALLYFF